jgi:hypothetical protein
MDLRLCGTRHGRERGSARGQIQKLPSVGKFHSALPSFRATVSFPNVEGEHHPDALVSGDFKGLVAWIDNYCRSNPLDPIVSAAFKLTDELRSRAQRR